MITNSIVMSIYCYFSKSLHTNDVNFHFLVRETILWPFLWNLNFRRNLSDSEIEDLEGLMRSLDDLYLSPSVPDARL